MAVNSYIQDGSGSEKVATVTTRGELVVGSVSFSTAYAVSATVINTGYNFVGPVSGEQFVVTDILLYADKNVGASDASVQLYEATSSSSTTVTKSILDIEMPKNTSRDLTGLNLGVTSGRWLNIKTNDNNIYATVMGYYVPA